MMINTNRNPRTVSPVAVSTHGQRDWFDFQLDPVTMNLSLLDNMSRTALGLLILRRWL